ncbi:MAG: 50S ribosomal protein L22 [candidate division Zixibacteria bacterium]|nr:50S ribosomal protein L22 [candidate division Zixibacteria bacterium]MDH3937967.1 50S ribosomal protein L22 [candidate division Zixibacteria bacterium]MDH4034237.1 50S ribosomal protein L22 [candidate division Zixibacteria bacterium]
MIVTSTARLRYVSIPPRKMRLVADMVKGMQVQKALDVLNFTPKIAARHIAKTVKSAAANALSAEGTDVVKAEDLCIKNITVDAAPTAKRIRFQSMGRVYRYKKRFCHLTVLLQGESETTQAPSKPKKKTKSVAKSDEQAETKPTKKKAKSKAKAETPKKSAAKSKEAAEAKPATKSSSKPAAKTKKTKKDGE